MPIINRIADFHGQMQEWRHDIHAHPEIAFEEDRTSDIVARELETFAAGLGVDMPITRAVCSVLFRGVPPRDAVGALLARDPRAEA